MAKLQRYTQTVFGSSADTDQISTFGSLANGTPALFSGSSINPALVQNGPQYFTGWFSAVEGAYSPAIEDMNALNYLYAYQLSYTFQTGIPEWDFNTVYYIGSLVNDGEGTIYNAKVNNISNSYINNGDNWQAPFLPGISTPNLVPYNNFFTIKDGTSVMWPFMKLAGVLRYTVPNNTQLIVISNITLSDTTVLQITGTGIGRII